MIEGGPVHPKGVDTKKSILPTNLDPTLVTHLLHTNETLTQKGRVITDNHGRMWDLIPPNRWGPGQMLFGRILKLLNIPAVDVVEHDGKYYSLEANSENIQEGISENRYLACVLAMETLFFDVDHRGGNSRFKAEKEERGYSRGQFFDFELAPIFCLKPSVSGSRNDEFFRARIGLERKTIRQSRLVLNALKEAQRGITKATVSGFRNETLQELRDIYNCAEKLFVDSKLLGALFDSIKKPLTYGSDQDSVRSSQRPHAILAFPLHTAPLWASRGLSRRYFARTLLKRVRVLKEQLNKELERRGAQQR